MTTQKPIDKNNVLESAKDAPGGDYVDRLVRDWDDLAQLPESETHRLEIDVDGCNGWIINKHKLNKFACAHYLSTHTFYGANHKHSALLLRKCGFDVTVANWDIPNHER